MAGLLIMVLVGAVLVAYVADRGLKARARARRLRDMSERLDSAAVRAEEQQEQRHAVAQASSALTSFMPAISQPPLSVPDTWQPASAARQPAAEQQEQAAAGHEQAVRQGPAAEPEPAGQQATAELEPAGQQQPGGQPERGSIHTPPPARPATHPPRPADRATRS